MSASGAMMRTCCRAAPCIADSLPTARRSPRVSSTRCRILAGPGPGVLSHACRQPHRWAGAYACWGIENREAAVRVQPGAASGRSRSANFEVETLDGAGGA